MKQMHVCHLITRMVRGGAQRVVLDLIRGANPDRFRSTLITGAEAGEEGSLLDGLRDGGAPSIVLPSLVREIRPATDLSAFVGLTKILKEVRPDVLHCHTYKAGVVGCFAGRLAGLRGIVFSPHGHIFDRHAAIPGVPSNPVKLEALYWFTRAAQQCADAIVAVSPLDAGAQIDLRLAPARKYAVIRNGIDFSGLGGRPRSPGRDGGPIVGSMGRLSREKGHRFLIAAMKDLTARLPGARLRIAGAGAMEGELKDLAHSLGLGKSVDFLGYVDNIAAFLDGLDIYVQPSLYESQGLALIEAMAAGLPVIATRVGGVADVVDDGRTGLMVPPADPNSLAGAVERLHADRDLARRLGEAGSAEARSNHSLERMVRSYERLYESLAKGRRHGEGSHRQIL